MPSLHYNAPPERDESDDHLLLGLQDIQAANAAKIPTCDFCHGLGPFIHGVECPNGDAVVVSRKLCFKCFDSVQRDAARMADAVQLVSLLDTEAEVCTGGKEELPF